MTDPENQESTGEATRQEKKGREKERQLENADFGKRIRSLRQGLDLTLDALSRLTKLLDEKGEGISRVSLTRYENGEFSPGLREIRILSKALRMPLSFLVHGHSDDPMQFMPPSIEEALDQQIYRVVIATLIKHKLIPEQEKRAEERESPDYLDLLEQVKRSS